MKGTMERGGLSVDKAGSLTTDTAMQVQAGTGKGKLKAKGKGKAKERDAKYRRAARRMEIHLVKSSEHGDDFWAPAQKKLKAASCRHVFVTPFVDCTHHDLPANKEKNLNARGRLKVFVPPSFDGELFQKLVKHIYKRNDELHTTGKKGKVEPTAAILSMELITTLAEENRMVPKCAFLHPMLSNALRHCMITSSGFDAAEKTTIQHYIQLLGGTFERELFISTTHIIARGARNTSRKLQICNEKGKPAVMVQWLDNMMKEALKRPIALKDFPPDQYLLPILDGCCVCVSGLERGQRSKIENMVRENGGDYTATLTQECTHLICPLQSGNKYFHAKLWGLHTVGVEWLENSISKKMRLSEDQFPPSGTLSDLTPNEAGINLDEMDFLDALDGTKILLYEFVGDRAVFYQTAIRVLGGSVVDAIDHDTTHVILAKVPPSEMIQEWQENCPQLRLLTPEWLLSCINAKKKLSEQRFELNKSPQRSKPGDSVGANRRGGALEKKKKQQLGLSKESAVDSGTFSLSAAHSSILAAFQGLPTSTQALARKSPSSKPGKQGGKGVNAARALKVSASGDMDVKEDEGDADEGEDAYEGLDDSLMVGYSFGFARNIQRELKEKMIALVRALGGTVDADEISKESVGNPYDVDFFVVPLVEAPYHVRARWFVTACWLERCALDAVLYHPKGHFLFQPQKLSQQSEAVFSSLLLYASGFDETYVAHLTHLASFIGFSIVQQFSRKIDYVICADTSCLKFQLAEKFCVSTVNEEWLFDCIQQRKLLHPRLYPVPTQRRPYRALSCMDSNSHAEAAKHTATGSSEFHPFHAHGQHATGEGTEGERRRPLVGAHHFQTDDALALLQTPNAMRNGVVGRTTGASFGALGGKDTPNTLTRVFSSNLRGAAHPQNGDGSSHGGNSVAMLTAVAEETILPDYAGPGSSCLADCVIAVSKKLRQRYPHFEVLAKRHGATVSLSYKSGCTHLIHEGKHGGPHKDVRQARSDSAFIVHPQWLEECNRRNQRVGESLFPPSFKKSLALNPVTFLSPQRTAPTRKGFAKEEEEEEEGVKEEEKGDDDEGDDADNIGDDDEGRRVHGSQEKSSNSATSPALSDTTTTTTTTGVKTGVELGAQSPDVGTDDQGADGADFQTPVHAEDGGNELEEASTSLLDVTFEMKFDELIKATEKRRVQRAASTRRLRSGSTTPQQKLSADDLAGSNTDADGGAEGVSPRSSPTSSKLGEAQEGVCVPGNGSMPTSSTLGDVSADCAMTPAMARTKGSGITSRDGVRNSAVKDASRRAPLLLQKHHHHGSIGSMLRPVDDLTDHLSQTAVTYEDPMQSQRLRLLARIHRSSSGNGSGRSSSDDDDDDDNDDNDGNDGDGIHEEPEISRVDGDDHDDDECNEGDAVNDEKGEGTEHEAMKADSDDVGDKSKGTRSGRRSRSRSRSCKRAGAHARDSKRQSGDSGPDKHRATTTTTTSTSATSNNNNNQHVPGPVSDRLRTPPVRGMSSSTANTGALSPTVVVEEKPACIMITCTEGKQRARMEAIFRECGVRVWKSPEFNVEITHLISGQPARTEKFLGACARGLWVLKPEYVDACERAGKMVEEGPFEWGPQDAEEYLAAAQAMTTRKRRGSTPTPGAIVELIGTPSRWRKELERRRILNPQCKGAFEGWTVKLCVSRTYEEGLSRLLQCGGAEVVSTPLPRSEEEAAQLTHVFVESRRIMSLYEDLQHLMTVVGSSGLSCYKTEYISDYLVKGVPAKDSGRMQFLDVFHELVQKEKARQQAVLDALKSDGATPTTASTAVHAKKRQSSAATSTRKRSKQHS